MFIYKINFKTVIALSVSVLSSSGFTQSSATENATPSEYWASCAAAMTQQALIVEEIDKKNATSLYPAIGHYYKLSCAYSTPASTDTSYNRSRQRQMNSFLESARNAKTDSRSIAKFRENLEGQLLSCAAEQKLRAADIANITRFVNKNCDVDIKP